MTNFKSYVLVDKNNNKVVSTAATREEARYQKKWYPGTKIVQMVANKVVR